MTRESTTAKYLTNDWISFCLTFTPSIFIPTRRNFSPITLTPNRDIRVDCLLNVYPENPARTNSSPIQPIDGQTDPKKNRKSQRRHYATQ